MGLHRAGLILSDVVIYEGHHVSAELKPPSAPKPRRESHTFEQAHKKNGGTITMGPGRVQEALEEASERADNARQPPSSHPPQPSPQKVAIADEVNPYFADMAIKSKRLQRELARRELAQELGRKTPAPIAGQTPIVSPLSHSSGDSVPRTSGGSVPGEADLERPGKALDAAYSRIAGAYRPISRAGSAARSRPSPVNGARPRHKCRPGGSMVAPNVAAPLTRTHARARHDLRAALLLAPGAPPVRLCNPSTTTTSAHPRTTTGAAAAVRTAAAGAAAVRGAASMGSGVWAYTYGQRSLAAAREAPCTLYPVPREAPWLREPTREPRHHQQAHSHARSRLAASTMWTDGRTAAAGRLSGGVSGGVHGAVSGGVSLRFASPRASQSATVLDARLSAFLDTQLRLRAQQPGGGSQPSRLLAPPQQLQLRKPGPKVWTTLSRPPMTVAPAGSS